VPRTSERSQVCTLSDGSRLRWFPDRPVELGGLHRGEVLRVTKRMRADWKGKDQPGDIQPVRVRTHSYLNPVWPRRAVR